MSSELEFGFTEQDELRALRMGHPTQLGSFVWKVHSTKDFLVHTDACYYPDGSVAGSFANCNCSIGRRMKTGRVVYCAHVYAVWSAILEREYEDAEEL